MEDLIRINNYFSKYNNIVSLEVTPDQIKAIESVLDKYKVYRNKLNDDLEKKDNIINKMAEQLTTPIHSKEWVIEYYTKKVDKEA